MPRNVWRVKGDGERLGRCVVHTEQEEGCWEVCGAKGCEAYDGALARRDTQVVVRRGEVRNNVGNSIQGKEGLQMGL